MKILLLTEFFPANTNDPILTGGVEARTFHLSRWLSHRHRVTVWKRTSRYQFNSSVRNAIERCVYSFKTIVSALSTRDHFDIVEGTNALTYPLAYFAARKTGAKAVAWIPDLFGAQATEYLGFLHGLFIRVFEWLTFKLPWDGIIALSGETKKKILSMNPRHHVPMMVIHGGVSFLEKNQ